MTDQGQVTEDGNINEDCTNDEILRHRQEVAAADGTDPNLLSPNFVPVSPASAGTTEPPMLILPGTNVTLDSLDATRPKADGIAFPFKLGRSLNHEANASTVTLKSAILPLDSTVSEKEDQDYRNSIISNSSKDMTEAKSNGTGEDGSAKLQAIKRPNIERFETAQEQL